MQWTATSAAAGAIREALWERRKVDMLSGRMIEIRLGMIEGTIAYNTPCYLCCKLPQKARILSMGTNDVF